MNILIDDHNNWLDKQPELVEIIEDLFKTTLNNEGFSSAAEISLTLTDKQTIRRINNDYRHIDAVTDVISFPQIDWQEENISPSDYLALGDEPVLLGDIIMSTSCIEDQAAEYGHSLKREFAFLLSHSILHLLGYDHIGEDDEMFARQEIILRKLGISR